MRYDRRMKLSNLAATQKLAASIVPMLRVGDCLTLSGDVGAGKTTFARQILAIMAPELKDVPSPTYALMQIYETSQGQVWHYDLYRLNSETELAELAWEE
ncbi:MAG: tRNA (adenosine(37)-N6)-threonylcarbamoyltransferase complex ATPase subunit type 1 TsaE, partial [Alphaproteobacteria bacterium]|nr:tRNA (adenosine(37)-N6)-threonylcarbamoyltransferase complex ATPase subunit type 1 TsaE [Alphaproteobacteria bacterium]